MLDTGPYPLFLKQRIRGPEGHLSNQQAADLIKAVSHDNLKYLCLAHMSEKNNHREKALNEAKLALNASGNTHTEIIIGNQDSATSLVEL